jgi:hypothetical protein
MKKLITIMIALALSITAMPCTLAGNQTGYIRAHANGSLDLCRDDVAIAKSREINRAWDANALTWSQLRARVGAMEKASEFILVRSGTKVRVLATKPDPIWRVAAQVLVLEGEQKGKTGWMVAAKVGDCRSCDEWKSVVAR